VSETKRPSVTSIVLNYGTPHEAIAALDSLMHQVYSGRHRVVVVDNDSKDDSRAVLEASRPEGTELIVSDENRGFGGGLNIVLSSLDTDYAFILNSDARCVGEGVIDALVHRRRRTEDRLR
jgi:GT2 family glycosyltransferase